jgi:hypothetical protein
MGAPCAPVAGLAAAPTLARARSGRPPSHPRCSMPPQSRHSFYRKALRLINELFGPCVLARDWGASSAGRWVPRSGFPNFKGATPRWDGDTCNAAVAAAANAIEASVAWGLKLALALLDAAVGSAGALGGRDAAGRTDLVAAAAAKLEEGSAYSLQRCGVRVGARAGLRPVPPGGLRVLPSSGQTYAAGRRVAFACAQACRQCALACTHLPPCLNPRTYKGECYDAWVRMCADGMWIACGYKWRIPAIYDQSARACRWRPTACCQPGAMSACHGV